MKKRLCIAVLLIVCSVISLKAQFVLTPHNFVAEEDSSKNYIVVPFEGMSKHDLYIAAKGYLEGIFNNPKKVLTCTEDENIVVDYEGNNFSISHGFSWAEYAVLYKHKIDFKDGRIKISPLFKYAIQHGGNRDGNIIELNGSNFFGKGAVFGSKSGNLIFKKAKERAENECNLFIMGLEGGITKAKKDSDW